MNIRELFDMMERTHARLVCRERKMSVKMVQGEYYFEVWSSPKFQRGLKWHYKGDDFYKALLSLEGDDEQ